MTGVQTCALPIFIFGSGLGGGVFSLVLFTAVKTLSDIALDAFDRKDAEKTASRDGNA